MRLSKAKIESFRAIDQLEIAFDPRLTVFIGENAAGKTTVLDALAVGLGPIISHFPGAQGKDFRSSDLHHVCLFEDVFTGQSLLPHIPESRASPIWLARPYVRVTLESDDGLRWDRTKKRDRNISHPVLKSIGIKALTDYLSKISIEASQGKPEDIPVIAGYTNSRAALALPERLRGYPIEITRFDALGNALDATANFKSLFDWFILEEDLERRGMAERRNFDYRSPSLQAVRDAVVSMISGCRDPKILLKPPRLVVTLDRRVDDDRAAGLAGGSTEILSLSQFSDGYRTLLALTMDLARRMAQANPHRPDPLSAEAIVLIDEVDLHLHPSWQQTVLTDLLRTFPNTQFIVTTHSPYVVGSVPPQHIRILGRQEDGTVYLRENDASSYGGEVGRVLEEVFGVNRRPAHHPVTETLGQYWALVSANRWATDEAGMLRAKLAEMSPGEPELLRVDLEIRRQKALGQSGLGS